MKNRVLIIIIAAALVSSAGFLTRFGQRKNVSETKIEQSADIAEKTNLTANFGKIPLHFEPNAGQIDEQVKFLSRGAGYSLFLTDSSVVLRPSFFVDEKQAAPKNEGRKTTDNGRILQMKFVGANPSPEIAAENQLEGKTNYFVGNDASKWKTDISNFERVRYSQIYDGVDLIFYGNQHQLEYDFVVQPNTSPETIKLNFDGADKLEIAANGDLVFKFGDHELRQHKPLAYQEINGTRKEIAANYTITKGKGQRTKLNFKSEITTVRNR